MREFKFRGISKKTGKWIHGYYLKNRGFDFIAPDEFAGDKTWEDYEVIPETVGQFTGLLDKNGKEIYEGDIIFSQKCDCRAILHKVEYNVDNAMFVAKPIQGWDFDFCQIRKDWIDKYGKEVIGNVFDNLELLKTETL